MAEAWYFLKLMTIIKSTLNSYCVTLQELHFNQISLHSWVWANNSSGFSRVYDCIMVLQLLHLLWRIIHKALSWLGGCYTVITTQTQFSSLIIEESTDNHNIVRHYVVMLTQQLNQQNLRLFFSFWLKLSSVWWSAFEWLAPSLATQVSSIRHTEIISAETEFDWILT